MISHGRFALLGILAGLSAEASLVAPAIGQPISQSYVRPQSLEAAILEFAAKTRISISLPPNALGALHSDGLRQAAGARDGLTRLLAGTPFTFEQVGANQFRIIERPKPRAIDRRPARPASPDVVIISAREPVSAGDLPRDATRVDAVRILESGATSSSDLTSDIGGLSFTNVGPGRNKILLRGLSDGALSGRAQSLVGLYVNDTRITYGAPDPDLRLADVSSVEVLRGPQGALYGAGAVAGIMRIQFNPVNLQSFGGSAELGVEATQRGQPGGDGELTLNVPIIQDVFGVRAVAYDQQFGGWLDNSADGETDTNAVRRQGWRLAALGQLGPNWSIEASALQQGIASDDSQYSVLTASGLQRQTMIPEPYDNDFGMANVTLRGDLGWSQLTSSTSVIDHELKSRFDATGVFPSLPQTPGGTQPIDEHDALKIVVNETRLSSATGAAIPWVLGVFYADGDNTRTVTLRDGVSNVLPNISYEEQRIDKIDELALFGQATIPLGWGFSTNIGARLFRSNVSVQSGTHEINQAAQPEFAGHLTDTGFAPDLRLSYQPNRDALFYVSAARGYRAGGFNTGGIVGTQLAGATQPFRRYAGDEIWTYELGGQFYLLDRRLHVQTTLFHSDWNNVQTDTLVSQGFPYSGNVGDAKVTGLEVGLRYVPTDNLTFTLNGLVNEPEIRRAAASFPQATDGGLPGSPEFSGSASVRYDWRLSAFGADLHLFSEFGGQYVGQSTLDYDGRQTIGDYVDLAVKLGVSWRNWRAVLYGENLGDSDGGTYSLGNPYRSGPTYLTPLRPLTVGLSIRREF